WPPGPGAGAVAVAFEPLVVVGELLVAEEIPVTAANPAPTAKPPANTKREPRDRDRSLVGLDCFLGVLFMTGKLRGSPESSTSIR
ncbi:MAG: hypothetical protein M3Y36_10320, partial [Actinomycetota bacterium]|nr:hypothetical protein [Actinomycetota bacterium]